jgi:hypothetical protein
MGKEPMRTKYLKPVQLRKKHEIQQCCGLGMFILDPNFSIPDPHQRIYVFLSQKIVSKLSEI